MSKMELSANEKRENIFFETQRMIYHELPVLIAKIFGAAFANCECGTPVIYNSDIEFIQSFVETTEKVFNIAMEGQKRQLMDMLELHAGEKQ